MFNAFALAVYTDHVQSRNIIGQRDPLSLGGYSNTVTCRLPAQLNSVLFRMYPGLEIRLSEVCPITLMGLVNLLIKDCVFFLDLLVGRV